MIVIRFVSTYVKSFTESINTLPIIAFKNRVFTCKNRPVFHKIMFIVLLV